MLLDNNSPQGKAVQWLLENDVAHLCPDQKYDCPNRLVQRYALATMYFATGGDDWKQCSSLDPSCGNDAPFKLKTHFLSSSHECTWAGITCLASMCVNSINFGKYILDHVNLIQSHLISHCAPSSFDREKQFDWYNSKRDIDPSGSRVVGDGTGSIVFHDPVFYIVFDQPAPFGP